jgi:hypothetical protein
MKSKERNGRKAKKQRKSIIGSKGSVSKEVEAWKGSLSLEWRT